MVVWAPFVGGVVVCGDVGFVDVGISAVVGTLGRVTLLYLLLCC